MRWLQHLHPEKGVFVWACQGVLNGVVQWQWPVRWLQHPHAVLLNCSVRVER